jgi:tetratricopeptide (TPR) repeat protein
MKSLLVILLCVVSIGVYGQTGKDYLLKGVAKYNAKDYKGAIEDFTKTIEINPKNGTAYFNRGNCKYLLNEKEAACEDWSKSVELGNLDARKAFKKNCK